MTTCSASAQSYNGAEQAVVITGPQSSGHSSIPTVTWSQSGHLTTSSHLKQLQHPAVKGSWFVIFPASFAQAKSMTQPAGKVTRVSLSPWHPLLSPFALGLCWPPARSHTTSLNLATLAPCLLRSCKKTNRQVGGCCQVCEDVWLATCAFSLTLYTPILTQGAATDLFASLPASLLGLGTSASFPTDFDCWKPAGS